MSGGGGSKSPRGPLPKFGGPPSKSNYMCKICEKEIRRDKIKEHYGAYVDLGALNKPIQTREQALSRLSSEKRKHTDYFDRNGKLPMDFNNSEFWIKSGAKVAPSPRQSFDLIKERFSGKGYKIREGSLIFNREKFLWFANSQQNNARAS